MNTLANSSAISALEYSQTLMELPRTRRQMGSFYTPHSAAEYMAEWVVRKDDERILEPSFGDGNFLKAVLNVAQRKELRNLRLIGSELDHTARSVAIERGLINATDATLGDFLASEPGSVQAVIGNPPYVRLRNLPGEQRNIALDVANGGLTNTMDPSGSVWMPFVIHSMSYLTVGGRMAFVLPYDFTYVRYARPLWRELSRHFGEIRVQRTHERIFPDLLQDVVILFLDDFGSRTDTVSFEAFERVDDHVSNRPIVSTSVAIQEICDGERVFTKALLDRALRDLLSVQIEQVTTPARELVRFGIGYVSGDKRFFHPDQNTNNKYEIPASSLLSTITTGRSLKGGGLSTSTIDRKAVRTLFSPRPDKLSTGEERYIFDGERSGVSRRYKCQVRNPWFVVPGVRVPDVILGVFTECPIFVVNDADYVTSNSLLAGTSKGWSGANLATRWYTSLTLLQCELEVHSLGGGVMVMVPNEANRIRLPKSIAEMPEHLKRIDQLLQMGAVAEAYRLGDCNILENQMGLNRDDLELIQHGVNTLAHWRTSSRSWRNT